ncbi:MAG: flavodoxin family protein [Actinomycetota bacterium]|nr:flavodoxin family protein [Actinomycetota bacterium]
MVRILGIAGSPRQNGNTSLLLEEALKGARAAGATVNKIVVCNRDINPCLGCGWCRRNGVFLLADAMEKIYGLTLSSHGIILASPVYFNSLNAQTKALIDRHQCVWARKEILKEEVTDPASRHARRGLFLSTAGADDPHAFDGALKVVESFFRLLDIEYYHRLLFFRMEEKGAVKNHPTALRDAYSAGEQLVAEINRNFGETQP